MLLALSMSEYTELFVRVPKEKQYHFKTMFLDIYKGSTMLLR